MNRRIAVDSGLSYYRSLLADEGYEVVALSARGRAEVDAILLSGRDENVTGNETRTSAAFTLDVTGRQPEEVLYDLRQHFAIQGDAPPEPV